MSYIYSYFFPSSSTPKVEKVSYTPENFQLPPYFPSYTAECEEKYLTFAKCINENTVVELIKYEKELKEDSSLISRSTNLSSELEQKVSLNCFNQLSDYVNCMNVSIQKNKKIEEKKYRVSYDSSFLQSNII